MKNLKHLGIFLIAAIALLLLLTPTKAQAATYKELTYTVSNGEATITDCYTSVSGSYTIPGTINGYPVTAIGANAFRYCDKMQSIVIPYGVRTIGNSAFSFCYGLTSVSIPNSVTTIGEYAFNYCYNITSVTIPSSVRSLEKGAFNNCNALTSVYIPGSIQTIGAEAFEDCDNLTTVTIANGVTTIEKNAFAHCSCLSTVCFPNSVTSIGSKAFCTWDNKVIDKVIYCGTEAQWNSINIQSSNVRVTSAPRQYHSWIAANCSQAKKCNYCGLTEGSPSHNWRPATCTAPKTCYTCKATTGSALGHNWRAATCTAPKTCLRCYLKEGNVVHSWTAATCTNPQQCSLCGVTEGSVIDHNYINGICTACGGADPSYKPAKFDIDAARMILGNSLDFQFGVDKTKFEDITGVYAVVEKGTVTKTIPATQWGTANQYYTISYDGLAAKEMTDEIRITIYNAEGEAISDTKTDSVRGYVLRIFNDQNTVGKTMLVDMLNYGAAAQTYFGYKTDDLANSRFTDAQKAFGTKTMETVSDIRTQGPNYAGTRLVLESRIQMQVAFKGVTTDMYATYSYTDHLGTKQVITVAGKDFVDVGGMYAIELNQMVYADARYEVMITVFYADGTVYGSAKDSIESYANRFAATMPLVEALMKFTDSAKTYLHQ